MVRFGSDRVAAKYLKEFVQENKFKGNGRGMRNLFDSIIEIQANRIVEEESEEYEVITKKDIFELGSSKKEVELV